MTTIAGTQPSAIQPSRRCGHRSCVTQRVLDKIQYRPAKEDERMDVQIDRHRKARPAHRKLQPEAAGDQDRHDDSGPQEKAMPRSTRRIGVTTMVAIGLLPPT